MDPVKAYKIDIKKSQARRPILLFFALVLFLPFFESKKIIMWDSPRGQNSFNIFHSFIIDYAKASESFKAKLGLRKNNQVSIVSNNNVATSIGTSTGTNLGTSSSEGQATQNNSQAEQIIPENINKERNEFTVSSPYRFLILGDSFMAVMGGVGDILESKLVTYQNSEVLRFAKVSSGLSRPDYFDWPNEAKKVILDFKPNIVVIMMGTNDAQSFEIISSEGQKQVFKYGTQDWEAEYRRRVRSFLQLFKDNNIFVYWVGMPNMKDAEYAERIRGLNFVYEQEISNFSNAIYFSTWGLLSDANGNCALFMADNQGRQTSTRISDGVHLTRFAGELVVAKLIDVMREKISLQPK